MAPARDPQPRGAVVVVAYGSSALLAQNLPPLADAPLAVVVVDNHSTDAERAAVTELAREHGWELVPRPNLGFGAGVRTGVARARHLGCDAVLLLNPDVSLDAATALALVDGAREQPDTLTAPQVVHPDGSPAHAEGTLDLVRGRTRTRPPLDPALPRWLTGACVALSLDLWERSGGVPAEYFMYWEDVELSHRVRAVGGRLRVRTDLTVAHDVGGTQGTAGAGRVRPLKSPLYRYVNTRNRLLFARRNLPRRAALRWLASTPGYAWRVMLRDGRRPLLRHPWSTTWPVVRGSLAGARIVLLGR